MTLSTTTVRATVQGSGITGPFSFLFKVFAASDLNVEKIGTTGAVAALAYPTDYTVAGVGNASGGTVTLNVALAVGETLSILRATPNTQPTSFRSLGTFFPASHEDEFDRLTMLVQQHEDTLSRAVRLSPAFDPSSYALAVAPSVAGQFLQWTGAGVTWAQPSAPPSITVGSSLGISNGSDDTTAFQTAVTSASNSVVYGVPGQTYLLSGTITPPDNVVIDLNGATIKPIGSVDPIKTGLPSDTASSLVTAGATQASNVVTLSSVTGFTVGGVVRFTTDYSVGMPGSWSTISSINVGANQLTLDSPFMFSYAGNVTCHQVPLRGKIIVRNGYVDLSAVVAVPGAVFNLAGYDIAAVRNVHFSGGAGSLNAASNVVSLVTLTNCRTSIIEDATARNVNLATGACWGSQGPQFGRHTRLISDGDCFGSIITNADIDIQEDIIHHGRLKALNSGRSIRAVKSSSCRHSLHTNVYASDCETVLEIFNCSRINAKNINGVNIGLKAYVGQTAITYAATLADGNQQFALFDGINLDNIGGNGIQTAGDATGRVQISNVNIKNAVASPVSIATSHTSVRGVVIENWNTGAIVGAAAIVSSATSTANALQIDGVTAVHTDNTKPVLNIVAGPLRNTILNVVSPTGNPIYDTTNGIDAGGPNVFSGAVAGSVRSASVARVNHVGGMKYFSVPNTKTFTFTTATFAKCFVIELGSGGQGALVFADQSSATITLLSNPSAIFVASSAPSGQIGIFKSAGSDIISIKNGAGATVTIGVCAVGMEVITTTDPA